VPARGTEPVELHATTARLAGWDDALMSSRQGLTSQKLSWCISRSSSCSATQQRTVRTEWLLVCSS
jgi:hypothetical protein